MFSQSRLTPIRPLNHLDPYRIEWEQSEAMTDLVSTTGPCPVCETAREGKRRPALFLTANSVGMNAWDVLLGDDDAEDTE
jgi:hypothetical protein